MIFKVVASALALLASSQAVAQDAIYVECTFASGRDNIGEFGQVFALRLTASSIERWNDQRGVWREVVCTEESADRTCVTTLTGASASAEETVADSLGARVRAARFTVDRRTGVYRFTRFASDGEYLINERGTCAASANPEIATQRRF